MMETKLCVALCALLLINFGPAAHGDDNAAVSSPSKSTVDDETAPEVPPTESVPTSSLEPFNHPATSPSLNHTDPSSRVTSILSNTTTAEGQSLPLPVAKNENGTAIISPSEATVPEMTDATDETTSQPPIPPPGSVPPTPTPTPTPTPAPAPAPASTTSTSPAHTTHAAPLATTTTTPPLTSTSHHPELPPHDFTTPSHRPTHPKTHPASSSTSAPAPEPPKTDTPTDTSTTTTCRSTTKAQSSSTSSTRPPHEEPPSSESPIMVKSVQNTSPYGHIEPITEAHPKSTTTTTTTQSSPSSQAKAHAADNPSQLNVGGDTTMVHDSPTLDPLLAGLVSAFIITAVIITMLLFLKLRRRDNRPEFRRLQDLPMDDMMEDTPLSMYNY